MFFFLFRLSSRGIGNTVQPERLGQYTYHGKTKNGRKIYQKEESGQRDQFLYFWDWGANNGANWMVGLDTRYNTHGIESANMENATYDGICATNAQFSGPFRVCISTAFKIWVVSICEKIMRLISMYSDGGN